MSNDFSYKELENLSPEERKYALEILKELSKDGYSKKYQNILYDDYEEIPVEIGEFLHNPIYLGKALTDEEGRWTLFPYWEECLKKIFPNNVDTAYNTGVFTGAIGLGKSTVADIVILYQLYRLMCLKNPYTHYGLQEIDKITVAFMNITKDAAKGVAWSKCQNMLQRSDWFMQRGVLTKSDPPEWKPLNSGIELIYGSLSRHIIGRAVFACLDGETIILTSDGEYKIKDLVDKPINVYCIDEQGNSVISETCTVKQTKMSNIFYKIELEDGTIIKCTPEHKLLLTDGTYKQANCLTESDELFFIDKTDLCLVKVKVLLKIKKITKIITKDQIQYYDVINANPYNNFLIKSNSGYICSHNCFFDEISFQPNQDVEKQRKKASDLVDTAAARMQSRFMKGEKNPTILMLASSKRTEQSYLESFIENKKKNDSKTTLIVDEPQWVIRTDKDSPNKFKVAIGNKFLNSEVLPLSVTDNDLKIYRDKGFKILEVPMGYYESFIDDIDIALTDIAGISTSNSSRYISGPRLATIKTDSYKNPFTKEIIEVGNDPNDTVQYSDFFDMNRVDRSLMSRPLFIHLDMSVSGDKSGIAGTWIVGKRPPKEGQPESRDALFKLAFSVSVKAPKGHQISFEKNRQFIYWLKEQGFAIKMITSDSFQSVDTGQALKSRGYNYEMLSVDRVDSDRICKPYQYLKSTIYEERIEMYESTLLTEELIGLERNNNSGKIDHTPSGINSKDQADAVCGSVYTASKHAEEYAFDFGETLDIIKDVSSSQDNINRTQVSVDFENELSKIFDPIQSQSNQSTFRDFGFGKATEDYSIYASQGIFIL